ncbi:MAG TPA: hypothetical protein PKD21_11625 [Candidatus Competibacter phosphatis]|nr:hypothetical protein [Candidatus Competibacter phosphatis]
MPCSSAGYIVQNGTHWKKESDANVKSQGNSAESHAERQAYKGFGNKAGPYLIVQDAFPCYDKCHQYFLNESKSKPGKNNTVIPGYNIIIKVTADNTNDAQSYVDNKVTKWIGTGSYPYYMYYRNGSVTFRAKIPNAPPAFPPHPSPAGV